MVVVAIIIVLVVLDCAHYVVIVRYEAMTYRDAQGEHQ